MAAIIAKVFLQVNGCNSLLRKQHLRINLVTIKLFAHQGRCPHPYT